MSAEPTREKPTRARLARLALLLTAIFDVLALLVLVSGSPIVFTVFMFFGQTLFGVALVMLLGAILVDLRAKGLL